MGEAIRERAKTLVTIGEAAEAIAAESGGVTVVRADSMEDAVERARESAAGGDVVLLSPGCASFDMFLSAEDRGERFVKAVHGLREHAGA
jgi:UDP-N-acetylmuramoylalanine--D-glutamate ligase